MSQFKRLVLLLTVAIGGHLADAARGDGGAEGPGTSPEPQSSDARMAPYGSDPDHLWNRLHRALFARRAPDGTLRIHSADPLLYRNGTFLLDGEPHRRAVSLLEEFLSGRGERLSDDPMKRLYLQRDLWAAFDYAAWYPDEWVHLSQHEAAAIALRNRLAKAIGRLALSDREVVALPDNYALAVKSKQFAAEHDPEHPERPFLPADLLDPAGPWVRFHDVFAGIEPMARRHFDGAGGRAAHVIFLRLPAGRAATEQYLQSLGRDSFRQFPRGTMVLMVRRAMAVDQGAKVRVTPVTELVQIRVYRRIPEDPEANLRGDFGAQDVCEFVLDRKALFSGGHGLQPVGPDAPAESFERFGSDPFEQRERADSRPALAQLKTCIECHQAPGIHSVSSMERGLKESGTENFPTYGLPVELSYSVWSKVRRHEWGLLQGMLEARRVDAVGGGGNSGN